MLLGLDVEQGLWRKAQNRASFAVSNVKKANLTEDFGLENPTNISPCEVRSYFY